MCEESPLFNTKVFNLVGDTIGCVLFFFVNSLCRLTRDKKENFFFSF